MSSERGCANLRLYCLLFSRFLNVVYFVQRDRVVMDLQVLEVASSKSSNFVVVEMCIKV